MSDETKFVPPEAMREDVFNEVIYGLDVLHRATLMADYPNARGILFALDYVKAMKELEA